VCRNWASPLSVATANYTIEVAVEMMPPEDAVLVFGMKRPLLIGMSCGCGDLSE